jgi:trans-aconitate methyltransferase
MRSVCASIEFLETTYVHRMDGVAAIIESMRETSLAPFLAPLADELRQQFLKRNPTETGSAFGPFGGSRVFARPFSWFRRRQVHPE